jgi:large subunit ribosomal protein L21
MAEYAIISVGGKQYVVREGERLFVDRLSTAEGKTFQPDVLLVGGNGKTSLSPRTTVTAKVVGHVRGEKIRIGKYRPKTGYRRHTGFRAALSQIEIQSIGAKSSSAKTASAEEKPKAAAKPNAPARSKATTTKKPAARKPAPKNTETK